MGIRIHRAADAPDLLATDFIREIRYEVADGVADEGVDGLDAAGGSDEGDASAAPSSAGRMLVRQTAAEGGFSLVYLFFKPHYVLGRHRHESDCLYVVVSGAAILGSQTLRPGDSFFVPAGAPYGYRAGPDGVEVLEIRHGVESVTTAFAGSAAARRAETRALAAEHGDEWRRLTVGPMLAADQNESPRPPRRSPR